MKWSSTLMLTAVLVAGCQTLQLQHSTVRQSASVSDLYYRQIMNNIAMLYENPSSLPYFSQPQFGQTTTQYSITATATPEWDLVTTATRLLGVFAFAKQSAAISGADTNIEMWNTAPTLVPDKILLMKYAYEAAFGNKAHFDELAKVLDAEYKYFHAIDGRQEQEFKLVDEKRKEFEEKSSKYARAYEDSEIKTAAFFALKKQYDDDGKQYDQQLTDARNAAEKAKVDAGSLKNQRKMAEDDLVKVQKKVGPPEYSLTHFSVPYTSMLYSGWFELGQRHQVPKCARYVGHYGKTYAWVRPGEEERLAEFTLVILDIATFEAPDREKRAAPPGMAGKAAR